MMKKNTVLLCFVFLLFISSCELLNLDEENGLSSEEIIDGLKMALQIGADSSTTKLSAVDGYYMDDAVKILLPPEADVIYDNLSKLNSIPGGSLITATIEDQLEKLVVSINRSAEDAADDALPILGAAITDLSISDGWDILNGKVPSAIKGATEEEFDSLAATHYMEQQTKTALIDVFSDPMNEALQKPLVFEVSAYGLWNSITTSYNNAANTYNSIDIFDLVADIEPVNTDIGEFVTGKAMDGLFLKVGEEEKKIRKNPWEWAVDIIQRVFGYIQEQL
jgi:hypothetical protein